MGNIQFKKLDIVLDKIKQTCEKLLLNNKLPTREQLGQGYKLFLQKFGPDVLKGLDGELLLNTLFHIGNRDGLAYWLEFKNDEEFRTFDYGSISGGSAFKYVMFKRNLDNEWVTGNPKNQRVLSLNEAVSLARELRDILIYGSDVIRQFSGSNIDIDDYKELQKKFDENMKHNMNRLAWVHKYYHMIYPDVIDDFHSAKFQRHGLIYCGIVPTKEDNLYEMAGYFRLIADKCKLPVNYVTAAINELSGPPVNYFRIGTGDNNENYWSDMRSNSYVAIGWSELGDLNSYSQSENMRNEIQERLISLYKYNNTTASVKAGEIVRFYKGIEIGDIVVAVSGERVYGIGKVTGNYEYIKDRRYSHCKSVNWLRIFNEPVKLPKPGAGKLTTCFTYKDIENIMEINRLISEKEVKGEESKELLPPLMGVIADIEKVLIRKKQLILYGPPGTGKTYYAEKACCELASRNIFRKPFSSLSEDEKKTILGDGRTDGVVRMCCFHPSYGYEDFIEGIKPRVYDNQTVFEIREGIFKKICSDALKKPNVNFYLIIDEINRGDISRIFGELIMLIEKGKRGKQVLLPLSNESFAVPKNVYIIGTMNTADRSIALLDVALRRRFGFIELMPDYTLFEGVELNGLPLGGWLKELNSRICEYIGKDARNLQIGHSYFLEGEKPITAPDKFKQIVKEDIIPLIEEYCYGDYSMISKILGEGMVDVKNQTIKFELFNTRDISDLVTALLSPCPTLRAETKSHDDSNIDEESETNDSSNGVE
ncbi:AAA family ATPase [Acetivibrio clariflavus]|uniref:GTPase subunit of restriction endonuclease n=1 Tax=Acetivibrio clariflavus (strain DSM 19732 / NBRC 101661 / EBR45) TaxID=720554 RepID=G8M0X2_ACECE|nr:AAA family ATPase [Acetivibrio clariflavus]AEV70215.1 GTPase subunit of restriction endonuclease [Acetivibrio clariflavus DSM 19732]